MRKMSKHVDAQVIAIIIFGIYVLHSETCRIDFPKTNVCQKDFKPCGQGYCCYSVNTIVCAGFGDGLTYLPETPFRDSIIFQNNSLKIISKEIFFNITHLSKVAELVLCDNDIHEVATNSFQMMTALNKLDLSDNEHVNLTALSLSFKYLGYLKVLILENIGITYLTPKFFKNLNGSRMSSLILSRNNFTTLDLSYFINIQNLQSLQAASCKINNISMSRSLQHLSQLSIRNNLLTGAPPSFCLNNSNKSALPDLTILDLRDNLLSELAPGYLKCVTNIVRLAISGNVITVLRNNTFGKFRKLERLQIEHMETKLKTIEPLAFNLPQLRHLSLMDNSIHFSKLPTANIFQGLDGLEKLEISKNNFYAVSEETLIEIFSPLKKLSVLTMGGCKLSHIKFLGQLHNLKHCNLYDNAITKIHGTFDNLTKLTWLCFKDNRISLIKPDDFAQSLFETLEYIDLSSNPYNCTCDLMWFRTFIGNSGTIGNSTRLAHWPDRYKCHHSGSNLRLQDYRPTPEMCNINPNNLFRTLVIVLSSLVFVMLLFSTLAYRKRWFLRYWLYKFRKLRRPPEGETQPLVQTIDFPYDAYIIYNDEDSDFVHGKLHELLEGQMNYMLHIWNRDAATGPQLETMVDSIYSSRCVIAVVSSHFLTDNWCNFQMTVAFDRDITMRQENVFLVVLNDFEHKRLDKYWCVILTKTPSASWDDEQEDVQRQVFEQQVDNFLNKAKSTNGVATAP